MMDRFYTFEMDVSQLNKLFLKCLSTCRSKQHDALESQTLGSSQRAWVGLNPPGPYSALIEVKEPSKEPDNTKTYNPTT